MNNDDLPAGNRRRPKPIGPDMADAQTRPGLKPKASPLSVVKKLLGIDKREEQRAKNVADERERNRKLRNMFA